MPNESVVAMPENDKKEDPKINHIAYLQKIEDKPAMQSSSTYESTKALRKSIHYNNETPIIMRKDEFGNQITHNAKTHKISFRDDVKKVPLFDIYEIEQRKNKKSPCNGCIIM